MEIENLEDQTSKLVITKRKSKKRNKNKQQGEKQTQENGHQVKDDDDKQVTAPASDSATLTTNSSPTSKSSLPNDCANTKLDDLKDDRLHIKSNGIVLTNGDNHHHENDDDLRMTKKDDQSSSSSSTSTMSNNSSPIKNSEETSNENLIIGPKIESSSTSECTTSTSSSSNIVCRQPSDENHKINENGCEINNPKSSSSSLNETTLPDDKSSTTTTKPSTSPTTTTNLDRAVAPAQPQQQQSQESSPVIQYKEYESELQMPDIMRLIQKDLSEPYSIYTYRYFIHNWPKLCFLAYHEEKCVGAIVCKLDMHRQTVKRGYIAMLAVDKDYRKLKIGSNLVQKAIQAMLNDNADEVVLETEITNIPALKLYENLGFVRDKRLFHYYLNGVDALRLKLWFR